MRPGWPQALMVLPTQGLLVLVIGLPALWVFWLSLQQTSFGVAPEFVGLANYRFVLGDTYFWRAFLNTFIVVNVVVYLELALALADGGDVRGRRAVPAHADRGRARALRGQRGDRGDHLEVHARARGRHRQPGARGDGPARARLDHRPLGGA